MNNGTNIRSFLIDAHVHLDLGRRSESLVCLDYVAVRIYLTDKFRLESVEFYAELLYKARQLGGPKEFSPENVQKLYEIRRKMGLPGRHPADLCQNKGKANCHNCGSCSSSAGSQGS